MVFSVLTSLLQVLGTSLATLLLNVAGRRPLLMVSTGLCSLFMGMLGTIFFLKEHEPQSGKHHTPHSIKVPTKFIL